MSVQPSRRAFLTGKPSNLDPWLSFLAKLRAQCRAKATLDPRHFEQCAHLQPLTFVDIEVARSLCQQFGVVMCLNGLQTRLALGSPTREPKVLVVEPGRAWASPMLLDYDKGIWRFDAGCTLQVLQAAGIPCAQGAPPDMTLAHWLAIGTHHVIPAGQLDRLGIQSVQVMFEDGTIEVLGSFGASDSEPLRSSFAQRNIARLFEWIQSSNVQGKLFHAGMLSTESVCRWPDHLFRVDAMWSSQSNDISAHPLTRWPHLPHLGELLVGHQGRLAWIVAVTFCTQTSDSKRQKEYESPTDSVIDCANLSADEFIQKWNNDIKNILDASGVFLP